MIVVADTNTLDREDWLDLRRQGIGASDIGAIAGLSPFATPMSVWLEKRGDLPDGGATERMRWGNLLENAIADEFERREGLHVCHRQLLISDGGIRLATLDGLACDSPTSAPEDALGVVEIKNTEENWDEPPATYQAQIQWQIAIAGAERGWIAALYRGNELRLYPVDRDDRAIELLDKIGRRFWEDHVLPGIPPPVDGAPATTDALKGAYGRLTPSGPTVPTVEGDVALMAEWRRLKAQTKATDARIDEIENELRLRLADAEAIANDDGDPLVTWKPQKAPRNPDLDRLEADHPGLLETYRPPPGRTMRVLRPTKHLNRLIKETSPT